ncbi:AlpA family phage regulatory protein [Sinorhizobium medicae]|uniref:helix-turn-helix transcriptional regulator n=1 Tax=Rhizobium meliloti TaxID=382 RepID=UPI001297866B|nr:AlpA family phage regulatory protein [Sinorhizobium meliloti]MDW9780131.1 AlpA family phage regulatory protein [Sinorhizobium meliloti]MDX0654202.1 AlpA family phage regulatory protein [Sinorhizobium medicae]MQV62275.1 AlpA family phage regulatory protein [Sinorhizobium meliloti]
MVAATLSADNDNLPDRLLKLRDVRCMTSLGTSTIYRKMKDGSFPRPRQLSEACVRWRESEIMDWIRALPAAA